jgi:hypothetical protein
MPTTFLAIYHGQTVSSAELLAVSSDPDLVQVIATKLALEVESTAQQATDPLIRAKAQGRATVLRLISQEPPDVPTS